MDELSIDEDALLGEIARVGDGARARADDLFDRIARYWDERRGPSAPRSARP
jgi:hypothetical protein